jgi:hypothetical protein
MVRRTGRLAAAVAAAWMLALGGGALAGEQAAYPIWWSPRLGLESLDQVEARLDDPFPLGIEVVLSHPTMKPRLDPDRIHGPLLPNQEAARNCRDLVDLMARAYIRGNYELFTALGPRCHALEALRRARPARTSHLRDFVFDERAIGYLPAMLGPLGNCEYLRDMLEANRRGPPWGMFRTDYPYFRIGTVESGDRDSLIVTGKPIWESTWVSTIEIYGRGDFNGDGLDDLLVRTDVDEGIASWGPRLFLVTRAGPKETLRVAWEYGVLPTIYSGCRYGGYELAIPDREPFPRNR